MTRTQVNISHPSIGTVENVSIYGIRDAVYCLTKSDKHAGYEKSFDADLYVRKTPKNNSGSYELIYDLIVNQNAKCEDIGIEVYVWCGGKRELLCDGFLELKEVCEDDCKISFDIADNSPYRCFDRLCDTEFNFAGQPSVTTTLQPEGSSLSIKECRYFDITGTGTFVPEFATCPEVEPLDVDGNPLYWWIRNNEVGFAELPNGDIEPGTVIVITTWWRLKYLVPTGSPPPDPSWIFVETIGANDLYVRCPYEIEDLTRGRLLSTLITNMWNTVFANCGFCKVVSNFFGINADGGAPSNVAYDNSYKVQNIVIYQRSDVKKPNSSNPAGSDGFIGQFGITPKNLLKMLNAFNIDYRIERSSDPDCEYIFRIEHVSWFEDYSNQFDTRDFDCTVKYTPLKADVPSRYEFEWGHSSSSANFEGASIFFDYDCTNGREDKIDVCEISTNLDYIINGENDEDIPSEGFVFVSTSGIDGNGNYPINVEQGILIDSEVLPNMAFSWASIHDCFWRHCASTWEGLLNNEPTLFESIKPNYKASDIERRKHCCVLDVDIDAEYITCVGDQKNVQQGGTLQKYCYSLSNNTATYEVRHACKKPV